MEDGTMRNNYVSMRVLPHQWKTANNMLLYRMNLYKKEMGYEDPPV